MDSELHDLSSRFPHVLFTRLAPGEHGNGAVWRIEPRSASSVRALYAHTFEEAARLASIRALSSDQR
ncbi:hypothetical protein [Nocardiopsis sp. FIRDI 009]|uniref:hypothetical protein n=1 Tax=Nocardiopsis sp. FIRDI 009 TaxID=714197 RepID=UPI000E233F5A|nr:hypothetical protein [Nocardiopsis sp. FIRDI 009]